MFQRLLFEDYRQDGDSPHPHPDGADTPSFYQAVQLGPVAAPEKILRGGNFFIMIKATHSVSTLS